MSETVAALIDAGVPPDAMGAEGNTALHLASWHKEEGAVAVLMRAGKPLFLLFLQGRSGAAAGCSKPCSRAPPPPTAIVCWNALRVCRNGVHKKKKKQDCTCRCVYSLMFFLCSLCPAGGGDGGSARLRKIGRQGKTLASKLSWVWMQTSDVYFVANFDSLVDLFCAFCRRLLLCSGASPTQENMKGSTAIDLAKTETTLTLLCPLHYCAARGLLDNLVAEVAKVAGFVALECFLFGLNTILLASRKSRFSRARRPCGGCRVLWCACTLWKVLVAPKMLVIYVRAMLVWPALRLRVGPAPRSPTPVVG